MLNSVKLCETCIVYDIEYKEMFDGILSNFLKICTYAVLQIIYIGIKFLMYIYNKK